MPIIFIFIVSIIFISVVLFMGLSIGRRRATLYTWDVGTLRSLVTFKPLLGHTFNTAQTNAQDILHLMAQMLREKNAIIDGISSSPQHLKITHGNQTYKLSLHQLDKFPEEWALKLEVAFKHGTSAPHDSPQTRALLGLIQETLHGLPVGTVRWHKRQDFEKNQTDVWSYQPY